MNATQYRRAALLTLLVLSAAPVLASHNVNEQREANPQGAIQINGVAGRVEVLGWDKPQLQVTGTLGSDSDNIEISGDAGHLSVQVRNASSSHMLGGSDDMRLTIHVPAASAVTATLVSADFRTAGLTGDLELHTVSGEAKGQVGGNLKVNSVSGDVRLSAPAARDLVVKTVSGDIEVTGGDGESDVSTISGSMHIKLGTQSHVHFKSTSGDVHLSLGLGRDATVEGESLSGDVTLVFPDVPAADFDVETRTGDIDNCFGPKPTEPAHGPGQRLMFKNGEGGARVRVVSHTGQVEFCTDKAHRR